MSNIKTISKSRFVARQAQGPLSVLTLLVTTVTMFGLSVEAMAGTCGVLPFDAGKGITSGAAENIAALVSTEVDIRGGFELVLTTEADKTPAGCASKPSCASDFGRSEGFEQVVVGRVTSRGSNQYTITTSLIETARGNTIRTVSRTLDRGPDALLDGIPGLVQELITGKRPSEPNEEEERATAGKPLFEDDGSDFGEDDGPT